MLLAIVVILCTSIIAILLYTRQPKFGRLPTGEHLQKIKQSVNYKNGKFHNQTLTPNLTEGANYFSVVRKFFFEKSKTSTPKHVLPSRKTNLFTLDPAKNILVWFGHSSYFMQIDGKKFLVDPVLSGSASPLRFTTKSYKGTDVYTTDDIPAIDYLFISHDHWDHLDYETVVALKPSVKKIITGLGTGVHLKRWGFDAVRIIEKDWNEEIVLEDGFTVYTTPARHFSGRSFTSRQSLWMSFVLQTPTMRIYLGGDSGYDAHFKKIGNKFGFFDLAILECGQYDKNWKYIHMMPEELIVAARDLNAKKILPVHWAKFTLAIHSWNEPIIRLKAEAQKKNFPLLHPMIGEEVDLNENNQFSIWWEDVE